MRVLDDFLNSEDEPVSILLTKHGANRRRLGTSTVRMLTSEEMESYLSTWMTNLRFS